jgi:hypothetical protein
MRVSGIKLSTAKSSLLGEPPSGRKESILGTAEEFNQLG